MNIQEIQPTTVGKVVNGKVVLNKGAIPKPKPAQETPITPETKEPATKEKIHELGQKLAEMAVYLLEEGHKTQLEGKDKELKDTLTQSEKQTKTFNETQKKTQADTKQKTKETETKHKADLKGKDVEISALKKSLVQKEKEVKALFAQVKNALNAEE